MIPLFSLSQKRNSQKIFIENEKQKFSYLDLQQYTFHLIQFLKSHSIQSPQTIGIYHSTNPLIITLIFACHYLAIKIIFFNTKTPCLELIKEYFSLSQKKISLLFISDTLNSENNNSIYSNYSNKVLFFSQLEKLLKKQQTTNYSLLYFNLTQKMVSFLHRHKPLTLLYTSGTTGKVKIIPLSWNNHRHNAVIANKHLDYQAKDKWLLHLPLYHVSGLSIVFRTFFAKATLQISSSKEWIETLKNNSTLTHASFIPNQIEQLREKRLVFLLKKFKAILIGGSMITETIWQKIKEGYPFYPTYGMTENASQIAIYQKGMPLYRYKLLPHTKLKVSNHNIYIRGKCLFKAKYFAQENKRVKKNKIASIWFSTKDQGELNQKYLSIKGRTDNMFISGGENIQPEEIEKCLMSTPWIKLALIIPQPNKKWGQIPIAYIEPFLSSAKQQEINKLLKKKLPKYKIPKLYLKFPKDILRGFAKNLKISRQKLSKYNQSPIRE